MRSALFVVSVTVVINNRCLVPWAVIPIELDYIKEGKYGTIPPGLLLDRADHVETVLVGKDKVYVSVASKEMNVIEVCEAFGLFIKLIVKDQSAQLETIVFKEKTSTSTTQWASTTPYWSLLHLWSQILWLTFVREFTMCWSWWASMQWWYREALLYCLSKWCIVHPLWKCWKHHGTRRWCVSHLW